MIHGAMIWKALVSPDRRPENLYAYRSNNNECSLIKSDVFNEDIHCTVGDAIYPHPNRHNGEKRCQL